MTLKKDKPKILIICFIALVLINSVFISAIIGSMGNAKMILYPEVDGWNTEIIEKSILVKNVNEIPINITLITDDLGQEFLEIIDNSFILEPHTEKKAEFLVKVKKEGTYEGRINVFFSAINSKEPGVALSSSIVVIAKSSSDYEEKEEEIKKDGANVIIEENIENNKISKISNGLIFLCISTILLLIILVFLIAMTIVRKNNLKKKK